MKRLLCFLDGTWDEPHDTSTLTNVVKLMQAVPRRDPAGVEQIAHYEIGIATDSTGWQSFLEGAAGLKVADRIKSAYRFLCSNYQPGDEILLFGFSRGAFEARSLANMLDLVGLVRNGDEAGTNTAWIAYETNTTATDRVALNAARSSSHFPVRIRCLGVWDTVGNLGLPVITENRGPNSWFAFHDTTLQPSVDVALHALAIDEPRGAFAPTLWTLKNGEKLPPGQIVEQVWFAGNHSNVGGGLVESGLSDISLVWMAGRVNHFCGQVFDVTGLKSASRPDPLAEQYVPSTGEYRVSGALPFTRFIRQNESAVSSWWMTLFRGWRTNRLPSGETAINESIHPSAIERIGKTVRVRRGNEVKEEVYRPANLMAALRGSKSRV